VGEIVSGTGSKVKKVKESKAEARARAWAERQQGEAVSWHEELSWLSEKLGLELQNSFLTPGWQQTDAKGGNRRLELLRKERDRLLLIRNGLGWLSIDAGARFDRRLAAATDLIDAENTAQGGRAALKLSQAEHVLQLAWWSTHWNRWKPTYGLPLWLWVTVPLVAALGGTIWAIFDQALYPSGVDLDLPTAFFGAALWGLAGGLVNGLRTVHLRVQAQDFERDRIAWYGLSPILGLAFGAIVFLLFIGGLLSTGQDLQPGAATAGAADAADAVVNPTPILLLAVLAGFAQNAFIGALQQIISAQFRGAPTEDETPI
jgi:hypothetical protein